MEQVFLIATTSFVYRWSGSVNRKQRFCVPDNVAEELVAIGVAKYETPKAEEAPAKKSSPSQVSADAGKAEQPASSLAATASQKPKSYKPRGKKAGSSSQ